MTNRKAIAQDLLRELLGDARREEERRQAASARLRALVRAGRHGGLGAAELAEAAGLSRPGIYDVLRREIQGPVDGFDVIVLAAVAAGGVTTRDALANALGASLEQVSHAVTRLVSDGALAFGAAGYDDGGLTEIVLLGPRGESILRDHLRHALSRRPELWTAYLAVEDDEARAVAGAAEARFGRYRTALIPSTTRSDMNSAEVAISFDVGDAVALFNCAAEAWHELRAKLGLPPRPVTITAFSPPRIRSVALESFGRGVANAHPDIERVVMRRVASAVHELNEEQIAVRALTAAATALRKAVGQNNPAPDLATGEAAFGELQPVAGLRLDTPRERIQRSLMRALEIATDRLGPLPGGRLGSFRGASQTPTIVEEVQPTASDLAAIAGASGEAIGYAHAVTEGRIDAVTVLDEILGS